MQLLRYTLTFFILLSTSLFALSSPDPYKNIDYFKLDNGLKVYLLADTNAVNTQVQLDIKVGMSVEDENSSGLSHLLEHLIFRDQRVPFKDYLDYLKSEGATYVNGYTGDNVSSYLATIKSEKSLFLVEKFADMIGDKNVTQEDLEIEKHALQNEIGEIKWYARGVYYLSTFFKTLVRYSHQKPDIFNDSFDLEEEKERKNSYIYKRNNTKFTLEEVLEHYRDYYYARNMTLKVVGNFDTIEMKNLIIQKYAKLSTEGTKHSQELAYNAKLKKEAFEIYTSGVSDESVAYIGTRYILDDYKKYLILSSYGENLASRMQKLLRNELGQTYSVSFYTNNRRNGALVGVILQSLHSDFNNNVTLILEQIQLDTKNLKPSIVKEALEQSRLYYTSLEHDSDTLMDLVETQEYIQEFQGIYDKTPYEIFESIKVEEFVQTLKSSFMPEYRYLSLYKDYYFFPTDMLILTLLTLFLAILVSKRLTTYRLKKFGVFYTQREVLFSRRLTSKIVSFFIYAVLIVFVVFLFEWIKSFLYTYILGNKFFEYSVEQPYDYIYSMIDMLFLFIFATFIITKIFKTYFVKIDITENRLHLMGNSMLIIEKSEILEIKKVKWYFKNTLSIAGVSLLFFKDLVQIKLQERVFYLRTKNADDLVEDLYKWIESPV